MSGKLDQSLDEILTSRRGGGARRGTRNRAPRAAKAQAAPAPVGGIKKSTRPTRAAGKGGISGSSGGPGESKIIVSGLVCFAPLLVSTTVLPT